MWQRLLAELNFFSASMVAGMTIVAFSKQERFPVAQVPVVRKAETALKPRPIQ